MFAVSPKDLIVGRIYSVRYNGESRIVQIESHGVAHKSGKRYVKIQRQEGGKTVYRNYYLENIEILS